MFYYEQIIEWTQARIAHVCAGANGDSEEENYGQEKKKNLNLCISSEKQLVNQKLKL